MKILVTGGAGYIGSVVVDHLLKQNYQLVCLDRLSFGIESIKNLQAHENFKLEKFDIRETDKLSKLLETSKFEAVIHLAAIVGDPACTLYSKETQEINIDATKILINLSRKYNVRKFIFASTCSNYGKMKDSSKYVNEKSDLKPLSLYAKSKVEIEKYILNDLDKSEDFEPTILRFATVYGISHRMRFDLTINQFVKDAFYNKRLIIYGENFWRPYCHVDDFANAFTRILTSSENVSYNVFNVGDTKENYSKKMIAELILERVPSLKIEYVLKKDDPRDYKVNSDKIKNLLNFKISKTVTNGIDEIILYLQNKKCNDTYQQKYYNTPI
tara:strand:- start:2713 stop:3696 length:984 start_codon:yes stop_codon:yes gene_type:complete